MKTILLLDVDGCINADSPQWGEKPRKEHVAYGMGADREEFLLTWSPTLIKRLTDLHISGLAEIVWCTTWCPYAERLEELWDLPSLDRSWPDDRRGMHAISSKIQAARDVLAAGNRLVWIDDDVFATPKDGPSFGPTDLYEELTSTGRALLIRPKDRQGILPKDMDRVEAFCREGSA